MLDGILVIDKPKNFTSFDVVAKVRKALNMHKVGHTGTLDPMATGVLIVCTGKATKLVEKFQCDKKAYRTTLKLGIKTDTSDMTGQIIETFSNNKIEKFNENLYSNIEFKYINELGSKREEINLSYCENNPKKFDLNLEKINEILNSFIGKQLQAPSLYSSVKVNGRKLYEYARKGEAVDIPKREIEVYSISSIEYNGNDEISYTVYCSKGTYIRSLNEDIASRLGVIGTTKVLRRLMTGGFSIDDSIKIDEISEDKIKSIEFFTDKKLNIQTKKYKQFMNGNTIKVEAEDGYYNLYTDHYIGIGSVKDGNLQREIIVDEAGK